ncbi:MAG: sigma-54-dependent Fis family transcriptional regulator [Haliscomenobacter sp.]|nr:sigma-54-dependent Fis family transcriptional regulator [Haliscomenobacter sp.]
MIPLTDILIIDDEPQLRQMVARLLRAEDYSVEQAETIGQGLKALEANPTLLVLCDVKLPDGNGVEAARTIKERFPATEIILFTAFGAIHDGVQAIKNGAFDYLVKGDDNNKILPLVARAIEKAKLQFKIKALEAKITERMTFDQIIGESEAIQNVISLAKKVAPTDATVLLTGETGTGKEIFAKAIHQASQRVGGPFVAVNTSAFSREILESELFGHKAGSFTGAVRDKKGLLEEAHKGTLFLDEIGEMPQDLQAKLLRVLETGEFLKVGETKPQRADVRIIAATNRNLQEESNQGNFRLDLYYRLCAFQIELPSLNKRREDIPAIARYFLAALSKKLNKKISRMDPVFLDKLQQHNWRGNVRELRNIIERACILAEGDVLGIEHLPLDIQNEQWAPRPMPSSLSMAEMEKHQISKVLAYTEGNKTKAAELLGIGLTTLYAKIKEYGL